MKRLRKPFDAKIVDDDKQKFGLPHIGIPSEVLFNPELSHLEKILFGFVRNLAHSANGCWASNNYLGRLLGVGKQVITNGVTKLVKYQYVTVDFRKLSNGNQGRRIFINKLYPQIYSKYLKEVYKNLNTPLLQSLYPPIMTVIPPYNDSYSKRVNKKVKEEELSYIVGDKSPTESSPPEQKNSKPNLEKRNTQFIPLAEYLYEIIRSKKNIKVNLSQIKMWANEIRKLSEMHDIDPVRIKRALRWYKSNVGGQFIPVIESGYSLRMKFLGLEAAKERQDNPWEDQKKKEEEPSTENWISNKFTPELTPEEAEANIKKYGTATPWFDKHKNKKKE